MRGTEQNARGWPLGGNLIGDALDKDEIPKGYNLICGKTREK